MRFTVPGEPQGKARPRVVRNGAFTRTYTPEKTASYENLVKLEYQRQCPGQYIGDAAIYMRMVCYYGMARSDSRKRRQAKLDGVIRPTKKPDCDNVGKVIADSLNGIAYKDDAQIVSMLIEKYYAEIPRVEVEITEVHQHEGLHAVNT